ncbi:GerAB/ArcD/ProY family transporter, partial [Neobacillus drentensis]|uniref:GerAB/ArcD/ProY family transporter n=1 Tax=Neobacillus drentensis TaxID=220684 RepID=UPI002FFD7CA6
MKKMERGKISSLQMAILMYPTIIATGIIFVPGFTAKYAQQDLWIPPIMASLIGYVTVYIAYKLHNFYPNETVI